MGISTNCYCNEKRGSFTSFKLVPRRCISMRNLHTNYGGVIYSVGCMFHRVDERPDRTTCGGLVNVPL